MIPARQIWCSKRKERLSKDQLQIKLKKQFLFQKMIKTLKTTPILLLIALLQLALSMHISSPSVQHLQVDKELAALRDQQSAFEKQVVGLIDYIKDIEQKVQSSPSTNQKVILLEKAVLSERQEIFKLQNSILPPFNLSKNACKELTDQQKTKMAEQLQKAKDEVARLKALAAKVPANAEVASITSDISKQETVLEAIEKAMNTKCETVAVLGPTIFQTNLMAKNWILGKQVMDNIVEQYYQRGKLYHNVTNCPAQTPFYDGRACINCKEPEPIFNMQTSTCQKCPFDMRFDPPTHSCVQIPHYTDYKKLENYMLDAALPAVPTDGTTPCPADAPYFSGACVKCVLPSYWSVKENKCKECASGEIFDVNLKVCVVAKRDTLTFLEGTSRWVTGAGNFTNVLKERADLLEKNPHKYVNCAKETPYFDGIACITCPHEFSLSEKKCVSAPANLVFDANVHVYIAAETGKETNPKAANLITAAALHQTAKACEAQKPYYDGIACILCPDPYPLFEVATKKCVRCDANEQYDKAAQRCMKRPFTYISTNFNNLLGTPKTNLAAYKSELLDKVKNNGENIIQLCASEEYSDFTHCFKCQTGQKFNVETKKCDSCNGTVDATTLICDPMKTMLTDLQAKNLLVGPTSTLDTYAQAQKKVGGPTAVCPKEQPYAVGGVKCVACTEASAPYFDLQAQKCANCPDKLFMNTVSRRCEKELFVTNVAAVKSYIKDPKYPLQKAKAEIEEIGKTRKTTSCPQATPIATALGDGCMACKAQSFYNFKSKTCVEGVHISNIPALKSTARVIQSQGFTLQAMETEANAFQQPKIVCSSDQPMYDHAKCIGCPAGEYYYLKTLACYKPQLASNFEALQKSARAVEVEGATLKSQQEEIKKANMPVTACAAETPLFDGSKCIGCPAEQYFHLKDKNCYNPPTISNIDALTKSKRVVEEGEHTLANLQTAYAKIVKPKICPEATPYFNDKACMDCPADQYFNLKEKNCYNPPTISNIQALTKSKRVVEEGEHTLANLQTAYSKIIKPKICPEATPFFNDKVCIACPANEYFHLKERNCYNPATISNIQALTKTKRVVEEGEHTLANLQTSYSKIVKPAICPEATPLFNDKACIACPIDHYYELKTKLCYNPKEVTNVAAIAAGKNYVESGGVTLQKIEQASKKEKYPVYNCPDAKPMFDGSKCVGCKAEQFYGLEKKICLEATKITNTDALTLLNNYIEHEKATLVNLAIELKKMPEPKRACPTQTPFFNGADCISCKDKLYNLQTLKCAVCAASQDYDKNTHKCVKKPDYVPNINNNLWIVNADDGEAKVKALVAERSAIKGSTLCPADKPHFSAKAADCHSCPAGSYWNYDLVECFKCKPEEKVDPNTHKCGVTVVGKYQTNVYSKNLIFDGKSRAELEEEYQKNKQSYPGIQDCPAEKPYFDNFECIGCINGKPLFNIVSKLCVSCPENQVYSETNKECLANKDVVKTQPNTGKMYSSIF